MKVCHFTSAHKSGDVRIFLKECVSLAAAGHSVTLVAANCATEVLQGVNVVGVEVPVSGRFTRMSKAAKIVFKKVLTIDADVYHFHDPEMLRFALKLKKKGKKVVYDVHEDVPRQILGKYWINKYLRKAISVSFEAFENYVAKRVDFVVAATPFIRDRFLKINKNCIDVCNYPILDDHVFDVDWKNKGNEICYVGGITKVRGIVELLNSLEGTSVQLNLAGDFSPLELKSELESLAGWKNVNNIGFVGRTEIYGIFSSSKIGVVTLHPIVNYLDSLPIKMFEYMMAGIPVIASDFPLWKQIIEEYNCGICVDPQNPNEIRKAILSLLSNDELAEKMGQNGKKVVFEKFNWKVEENKLLNLYKRFES
ncbi:MAG: glycosyltransferase family 4 protein [Flavobacteriales bacterium]